MPIKKIFISSAYIYPVCSLNINHAKMFIVGDIIARHSRKKGMDVFFPVASHYSGNTAHKISEVFTKIFSENKELNDEEKKIFNLYKNIYNVPQAVLKTFIHPLNILNFYNQEILWELKSLNVSGDYEHFYTTKHEDFSIFINTVISLYEKNKLLINNKKNELALNYDDNEWKEKTLDLLNRTEFIQQFHKNNVMSAMKNIRSDWGFLRENGYGVIYDKKWIIDPMFDSELFTIFDLYMKFKKEYINKSDSIEDVFKDLFEVFKNKKEAKSVLVKKIASWFPCDVFICEEHLKNWIVKKLYAESALLDKKYQTKKYFILGMGLLNGKRMSASRGHAIFAKDLIISNGPVKARLIIILGGGHPSKAYNYEESLPAQADKLLSNFINYYTFLISLANKEINADCAEKENLTTGQVSEGIENLIQKGYYRQAVIELLSILPAKYKYPNSETARVLISVYEKYLDILLPDLLSNFDRDEKL